MFVKNKVFQFIVYLVLGWWFGFLLGQVPMMLNAETISMVTFWAWVLAWPLLIATHNLTTVLATIVVLGVSLFVRWNWKSGGSRD